MFSFDDEYLNLLDKYSGIDCDRTSYFLHFLQTDHSDHSYKIFLRSLSGEEYFFVLDLQLLLHKRCIDRLHKVFCN